MHPLPETLEPRTARYAVGCGKGLQLVVHPTGTKAWVVRYELNGRQETMTIGHWPKMQPERARKLARMTMLAVSTGGNPAEDRRREKHRVDAKITVKAFAERWLKEVVILDRKNLEPVKRVLEREVYPLLGRRPVARVTDAELRQIVFSKRDRKRPAAARALREVLKRLFAYGRVCGLIDRNPMEATPAKYVARLRSRTRVLSEAELRKFFAVLDAPGVLPLWASAMLELLLLTLARKSELRLARWEHVNLGSGSWEIPEELSKSGRPHIVYLSMRALILLRRRATWHIHLYGNNRAEIGNTVEQYIEQRAFVFASPASATQPMAANALNKAVARVKWGFPKFTPHDLRRTAATILNEQGFDENVIEAALNHSKRGIRGVYNRARYAEQRKAMLERWAEYLAGLRHGGE